MNDTAVSELARRTAERYGKLDAVQAVAMGGSRASRKSDEVSDIDLYVYVAHPLTLEQRAEIAAGAKRAEIGNSFWEPGDEWIDAECGIGIDVMFRDLGWIEEQMDRVLVQHQASIGYSTCFWYNVLNSELLVDRDGWFAGLQKKASVPYPAELKRNIVAKNWPILRDNISSYRHQIELALGRGDLVSMNHRVTALLASYFDIVFAINEQPHPGEKRLVEFAEQLCRLRPAKMREQVEKVVREPSVESVDELLDGIENVLKEADTSAIDRDPSKTLELDMAKVVTEIPKEKQPRRSTEKPSAWELGGLSWLQLFKRLWTAMDSEHDDTFGRSAELAFYFFLAVFPGLLLLLTILGFVAGSHPEFRDTLLQYIGRSLPPEAWTLVQKTITETAKQAGGIKLVVGLVGALWSASAGVSALMTVMSFAYHVKDRRPFWKSRLVVAPLLTIGLAVLMLAALGIVLFGTMTASWAGAHGLGSAAVIAWKVLQWPIALFFVVLAFATLYYWAPDVEDQKWYWITPGSLIGVGLWVVASAAFRLYLAHFNSYSATYGSLGAVIVLMLWFYITALALLIGAECNAAIESAAAEHGRADAKLRGEKEAPAA